MTYIMEEQQRHPSTSELKLEAFGVMRARHGAEPVHLGPPRHRAVLGLLLLRPGRIVPADQLIDELWAGRPPRRPHATLQTYLSHLRRALEPGRGADRAATPLHYRAPGYILGLERDAIDVHRFDRMVMDGQHRLSDGDFATARALLGDALELWRADPFLDLTAYAPLEEESARLRQLRTAAVAARSDALLALGETADAVAALRPEVARHPTDEHMVAGLMTGLYRLGRQDEALRLHDRTRAHLAEELGVAPGEELRRVHLAVLRHEIGPSAARSTVPSAVSSTGKHSFPDGPGPHGSRHREAAEVRPGGSPVPAPPLQGREHALAALRSYLGSALRGSGRLTAVVGEAGVGKTELLARAVAGPEPLPGNPQVIRFDCRSAEGMPPGWVWHQVLRRLDAQHSRNARAMTTPSERDDWPAGATDPGTRLRFLANDAFCEAVLDRTDGTPVLLVLEDVDRADRLTLDVLGMLAARTHGRPLGLVITVREPGLGAGPERGGALETLLADSRTEVVHLGTLSAEQVDALIAGRAGPEVNRAVARTLYERSGGNPYLLGQLLAQAGDVRQLTARPGEDAALAGVPAGVRTMLHHRFAGLATHTLRALRACAVLGSAAERRILTELLGGTEVHRAVEEALRTGLLRQAPDSPHRLVFRHGLVREVLLAEMCSQERADLHARALDVLDARRTDAPEAIRERARHAWQATLALPAEKALPHLMRGGDQAAAEGSYAMAEEWYGRVGALVSTLPSPTGTAVQNTLDLDRRLLHLTSVTRGYADLTVQSEARRLLKLSDARADAAEQSVLLFSHCITQLVVGQNREGARSVKRLLVLAEQSGAPKARLCAFLARGIQLLSSDANGALTALTEAARIAEDLPSAERVGLTRVLHHDLRHIAMNHRALALSLLGADDEAQQVCENLLPVTGQDGTPVDRASAHYFHALVAALAGDPQTAASSSGRGLDVATAHGLTYWSVLLRVCRSWAQQQLAEPGALDALESAVAELRERRVLIRLPLHLGLLAEAQHSAGGIRTAQETLRRAGREIRSRGERAYASPTLSFNGLLPPQQPYLSVPK
ncbi:BTAD domain-containing putative transcriptional regulator [Streptomyces sp. NPDC059913]|uniref:BTAD domain-containing putative transcriptional regulator n=1 Tax=unclassified Streptomyces TaxID=2593676 RepID=UPI00366123E6